MDSASSPRTILTNRFIAALVLFFIADLIIRFQIHPNPYALPERSFIWWAVHDYKQLKKAPDIMLFGSSLMLAAIDEGDAAHFNKLIDSATHHRSYYLEELLGNRVAQPVSTFCFAVGGQMASDVYAIASNFICPQFKPRLIIWGIAPRDLVDAAFPGASTSDTAQYMNKVAGTDLIASEHITLNSLIDRGLNHISYLYHNRIDFLTSLKQSLRNLQNKRVIPLFAQQTTDNEGRNAMIRQLMNPRDGTMGDMEIGECLIGANDKPSTQLKDNTQEYFLRYHPFKRRTFNSQVNYLQKFLQKQKDLGIKVVLVNMPLTRKNMDLLPADTYDKYLATVKDLAATYGANVIDFNHDPHFATSDFFDTAHLNGLGSEKLLQLIASCDETRPNQIQLASKSSTTNL